MRRCAVVVLALSLTVALLTGCGADNIFVAASRSPQFPSVRYQKYLVCVNTKDTGIKRAYEEAICNSLIKYGVHAAADSVVFSSAVAYTSGNRMREIKRLGYGAYLVLAVEDFHTDSYDLSSIYKNSGYKETVMKITCSATITDVASGDTAWTAVMKINEDAAYFPGGAALAGEAGQILADRLFKDGLLEK